MNKHMMLATSLSLAILTANSHGQQNTGLSSDPMGAVSKEEHQFVVTEAEQTDAHVTTFPSDEVMLILYRNLVRDHKLNPGDGLFSPNLDHELLQDIYKFAIKIGYINETTFLNLGDVSKSPLKLESKAATAACKGSLVTCLSTLGNAAILSKEFVSCAAAVAEEGVNPWADAACVKSTAAAVSAVTACAISVAQCTHTDPQKPTFTTSRAGRDVGATTESYCPDSYHAYKVNLYTRGDVIGRIVLTCTDGTAITFGRNDSGENFVQSCKDDYAMGGLKGRVGDHLDAAAIMCDKVVRGSDYADQYGSIRGGPGGGAFSSLCPEHQYVIGLKTWHERLGLAKNSAINGVEVKCR